MNHRVTGALPGSRSQATILPLESSGIATDLFFENLFTKKLLAEKLGLSQSYVSLLMKENGLPHLKIGRAVRFRISEVAVWLQKRSRP